MADNIRRWHLSPDRLRLKRRLAEGCLTHAGHIAINVQAVQEVIAKHPALNWSYAKYSDFAGWGPDFDLMRYDPRN